MTYKLPTVLWMTCMTYMTCMTCVTYVRHMCDVRVTCMQCMCDVRVPYVGHTHDLCMTCKLTGAYVIFFGSILVIYICCSGFQWLFSKFTA